MAEENFEINVAKPATVTGGITYAPEGTEVPEDAKTKLNEEFKKLGYVDGNGVNLTSDASDEDVPVWGGVKAKKIRAEYSAKLSLKLLSVRNLNTLKAVFGEKNVKEQNGLITVSHGSDLAPVQAFTIETVDDQGRPHRFVIKRGQVTVSGERNLTHAAADGLDVEIECLTDDTGTCYYEYTQVADTEDDS